MSWQLPDNRGYPSTPAIAAARGLLRASSVAEASGLGWPASERPTTESSSVAGVCDPGLGSFVAEASGCGWPAFVAEASGLGRPASERPATEESASQRTTTDERPSLSQRRGISLLEVLFSIFIISIGLLGLAALIPVGTVDVNEATKADRGASAGRAAHREAKVRGMFFPGMWMSPSWSDDPDKIVTPPFPNQGWIDIDDPSEPPPDSPVNEGHSVCIDPLFIARSNAAWVAAGNTNGLLPHYSSDPNWPTEPGWPGRAFPYFLDNDPKPAFAATAVSPVAEAPNVDGQILGPPRMSRVTLRSWPSPYAPMMSLGLADRVFRWQDDLLFELPTDDTLRPTAVTDLLQRPQSEGNYSWMATLTPVEGEESVAASQRRLYNYSVVVFYKRNLDMPVAVDRAASLAGDNFSWNLADRGQRPSERIVFADFLSPSISFGGGDVRLRLVVMDGATNNDESDPERNDFTNIRPGNWILLSGYRFSPASPLLEHHSAFQWYRVLAVDDGPKLVGPPTTSTASGKPEWLRDVTLAGPDWDASQFFDVDDTDTSTQINMPTGNWTCYATLVEGVVAVFTKTVELDTSARK